MASRLIKEKEQEKLQDKYMEVDKETGKLILSGEVNTALLPNLSNIVDTQGRRRYIEGGMTKEGQFVSHEVYAKWSLSGTHLLIVLCIEGNEDGQDLELPQGYLYSLPNLPAWIYNKVVPLWGNNVDQKTVPVYHSSSTSISLRLQRVGTKLVIYNETNVTLPVTTALSKPTFRITFDLLIDSD